jgi:hypothetical protein
MRTVRRCSPALAVRLRTDAIGRIASSQARFFGSGSPPVEVKRDAFQETGGTPAGTLVRSRVGFDIWTRRDFHTQPVSKPGTVDRLTRQVGSVSIGQGKICRRFHLPELRRAPVHCPRNARRPTSGIDVATRRTPRRSRGPACQFQSPLKRRGAPTEIARRSPA